MKERSNPLSAVMHVTSQVNEQSMLNEVDIDFRIPGLPNSVVKQSQNSRVRELVKKIENHFGSHFGPSHFGSRSYLGPSEQMAVSDHVFQRFPFDLLIQVSATQLSLFSCIPFVLMATGRAS